ncbi:flagellar protein FlaG [Clostridium vincentii]|uniref:Flagellar protein FlaG n=1 Tax=Clostridium vincentii TaxID=52704 RepID=A0A2T0BG82_9CLOT|nr:flagellar protein FlaG [Clostridium vincentii]PRR82837.1 flagellar protein FlaG [Clostridium vincentii]
MEIKVTGQGRQNNLNTGGYEISLPQNNMEVTKDVKNYYKQEEPYTEKDLQKAVNKLNNFLKDESTHAEYSVHDKFNIILIKIIDDKTKEVIMEVPPRKILDMVAKMCELVGIVFDKRA